MAIITFIIGLVIGGVGGVIAGGVFTVLAMHDEIAKERKYANRRDDI